jgi:hypothetical protein
LWLEASLGRKLARVHLNTWMVVHTCNPSYAGNVVRRIVVWGQLKQTHKTTPEK